MKHRLAAFILILVLALFITACSTSADLIDSPYSVGDIIYLGELQWRVLDVQDGKVLVISEMVLLRRMWHYEQRNLTWGMSEIRQYLNGPFFDETFSDEEKARIIKTNLVNTANPWYGSAGPGEDTIDRVFLLNLDEVIEYFGDSGQIRASPRVDIVLTDEYNSERAARDIETGLASWWWLRTPGYHVNPLLHASAVAVNGAGEIIIYGIYVISEGGVRPALWLEVS